MNDKLLGITGALGFLAVALGELAGRPTPPWQIVTMAILLAVGCLILTFARPRRD